MGKVRIKTFGDEESQAKEQEKKTAKKAIRQAQAKEAKKAEKMAKKAEEKPEVTQVAEKDKTEKVEKVEEVKESKKEIKITEGKEKVKKSKKEKFLKSKKTKHSGRYLATVQMVNRDKVYTLIEALQLLETLQKAKFDETVELHINTHETGISGNVTLPNGTGKQTRVVIADDAVITEIEKGKINFDILVAHPSMMPKLAKVAKILGPKGLMPNPKNGTISPKPEDVAKQYAGGQMRYKTETKSPIIHLTVGKISFGEKKLAENIREALEAIQSKNIKNATLKSTMSPGIKLQVTE